MTSTHNKSLSAFLALALGALGVVYGDIGTSVLYSINEIFFGHHAVAISQVTILGAISLAVWALTIVVTIKYVTFVLQADYKKEGGVFALVGLLRDFTKSKFALFLAGILLIASAGLLFGDGLITPAISVLSAVEGLGVAAPSLAKFIIPITVVILTGLFAMQSKGTGKVGMVFGPLVLMWFAAIGTLGAVHISHNPEIFKVFNPYYAYLFLTTIGFKHALFVMGSIMLVVTGGEALYADMGHFGIKPIRLSWFSVVYPALLLNYLGQGAFLLSGATIEGNSIFFSMVPAPILIPMVILATIATVIASQALISGVFSLTAQGMSLGMFPKLKIVHTNSDHEGQIYVPFINWALFIGCVILVLTFKSSTNLASAYGLAVSGDMLITTLSMIALSLLLWKWKPLQTFGLFIPLLILDAFFLVANSLKFFDGGYVPFAIGVTMFTIMKVWQWGKSKLVDVYQVRAQQTIGDFVTSCKQAEHRLPKALVVLSSDIPSEDAHMVPGLLQVFIDQYATIPQHVILLNVQSASVPYTNSEHYDIKIFENSQEHGTVASVTALFGYMQSPDVEQVIKHIKDHHYFAFDKDSIDWIILAGRERLVENTSREKSLTVFEKARLGLFKFLHRNIPASYMYFGLGEDVHLTTVVVPVKI